MTMDFRPKYRELSPEEKTAITNIKERATDLGFVLNLLPPSRVTALAKTRLEEAVMWAVKGVTG